MNPAWDNTKHSDETTSAMSKSGYQPFLGVSRESNFMLKLQGSARETRLNWVLVSNEIELPRFSLISSSSDLRCYCFGLILGSYTKSYQDLRMIEFLAMNREYNQTYSLIDSSSQTAYLPVPWFFSEEYNAYRFHIHCIKIHWQ